MQSILYATDFSDNSIEALNYAHALKSILKTRLLIGHVGDINLYINSPYVNREGNYRTMEREYYTYSTYKIMEFVNNNLEGEGLIKDIYCKINTDISAELGIITLAREYETGLIVTGLNGSNQGKIKEYFIGNNFKNLVTKSPCPVLGIPAKFNRFSSINNIYFLSNLEIVELEALQSLIQWANKFNAWVTILHVSHHYDHNLIRDKKNYFRLKLNSLLPDSIWSLKEILGNNLIEGLQYISSNEKVDMLSFLEYPSSNWTDKLYHKNLINGQRDHLNIPLLAFNKKNIESAAINKPDFIQNFYKLNSGEV